MNEFISSNPPVAVPLALFVAHIAGWIRLPLALYARRHDPAVASMHPWPVLGIAAILALAASGNANGGGSGPIDIVMLAALPYLVIIDALRPDMDIRWVYGLAALPLFSGVGLCMSWVITAGLRRRKG